MAYELLQEIYQHEPAKVRAEFGGEYARAAGYYRRYVDFVVSNLPCQPARILDVGCGAGWSTLMLRQLGHDAQGLDLHSRPLEARTVSSELPYWVGDVQQMPFPDGAFDVVTMFTVLEHVPDPQQALVECLRVVRPGGRVIVVGPHLLSVGLALVGTIKNFGNALRGRARWRRTPTLPCHPFGNTLPEICVCLCRNLRTTLRKMLGERPVRFLKREPDHRPPFHGDNDACYLCNPMDLVSWTNQTPGVVLKRHSAPDRFAASLLWPFLGGTWVVFEKRPDVSRPSSC